MTTQRETDLQLLWGLTWRLVCGYGCTIWFALQVRTEPVAAMAGVLASSSAWTMLYESVDKDRVKHDLLPFVDALTERLKARWTA